MSFFSVVLPEPVVARMCMWLVRPSYPMRTGSRVCVFMSLPIISELAVVFILFLPFGFLFPAGSAQPGELATGCLQTRRCRRLPVVFPLHSTPPGRSGADAGRGWQGSPPSCEGALFPADRGLSCARFLLVAPKAGGQSSQSRPIPA